MVVIKAILGSDVKQHPRHFVESVLISALMIGVVVVSAHGAFRTPEDLFLDEQDPAASTGFLSFLSGAAVNAAVSAARVVAAARV
ncbi:PRA1 family protein B4 [Tanacetum coccineum]